MNLRCVPTGAAARSAAQSGAAQSGAPQSGAAQSGAPQSGAAPVIRTPSRGGTPSADVWAPRARRSYCPAILIGFAFVWRERAQAPTQLPLPIRPDRMRQ
jgi:hypothetical protein